jgi:LPXTG-motif cell wall-anchored protein
LRAKLYANLILAFSLILFLFQPLTSVSAKQKPFTDQNSNKQTQIHLHVNKCAKDLAHVYVKIDGEWLEMSNPGNSPLYKLWDKGEYVKDDITEFSLITTDNEETNVKVSELKVGVEANGTINYWLEKCPEPHVEKQTEISFDLKEFAKLYTKVYIKLSGEWIELNFKENTTLYTLIVNNKLDVNAITEIKCITLQNEEIIIPISKLKLDWITDGIIKIWLEQTPETVETEQVTQICLDLKGFAEGYSKIYVKWNGKWIELIRHGDTTKFIVTVKGEFSKGQITEFKLRTSENKDIIIPIGKLQLEKDAKGTIEFGLKENPNEKKQTQIHLHLQKCVKDFKKVFVKLDGKWRELTRQGNSPLFKMLDKGEYVKDDITEFRFVTSSNQEITIPVSGLKVGVEAEGTINYWLQDCPKVDVPADGGTTHPSDKPDGNDKGAVGGTDDSDGAVGSDNGTGGSEGTSGNDNGVEIPTGELPQTGESSHAFYYLAGIIFIAIGTFILKFRLKKSF